MSTYFPPLTNVVGGYRPSNGLAAIHILVGLDVLHSTLLGMSDSTGLLEATVEKSCFFSKESLLVFFDGLYGSPPMS